METKSAKRTAKLLNSSSLTRPLVLLGAASVLFGASSAQALDPGALPQDPNVVGGKATFSQGNNTLNVNQSTNRTIIDWRSFNIGSSAQTNFNQPNSSSIAVNRVNGSANPTDIEGGLHANGQVWILNPNGVFFGKTAHVDAAGIVATTANINDRAFMAGSNTLQMTGADHGSVSNAGSITVGQAGLAAFVAPSVSNSGTINATVGKVSLAAGTTYTLDLAGDHLVELGLGGVNAVVDNSGKIVNPGGTIALTAKAASQVVNSVVNVSGVVNASSATQSGGDIILGGDNVTTTSTAQVTANAGTNGNGGSISAVANNQGNYAGTFSAQGGTQSGNGGSIETSGASVHIDPNANINASAYNGVAGTWLLDPLNVTIESGTDTGSTTGATVYTQTIQDQLAGGTSVDITTSQTGTDNGDLTLASSINATSIDGASLTLEGRHLSETGGSTISINGGALTLDVNTVNTLASTSGSWITDALNMIGTVSGGSTINLGAATYVEPSGTYINVNKSDVTIDGASEDSTIIDARSAATYGLRVSGPNSNVTLENFTLYGATGTNDYGLKAENTTNLTLTDITSRGAAKSEFDINGIIGGTLTNLTADGAPVSNASDNTTTAGNGIGITDSQNIDVTGSTTENNAWGGIALYQTNSPSGYPYQEKNITIDGTNTLTESNPIYAEDQSTSNDFGALNLAGYDYIAQYLAGPNDFYTLFRTSEQGAIDAAAAASASTAYVQGYNGNGEVGTNTFYVGQSTGGTNLSIQAALNGAASGATIDVSAGTYAETLDITKNVDIEGAGVGQTIIQPTALLDTGVGHKYTSDMKTAVLVNGASDVTLDGLTIDADNASADAVVLWNNASGTIENSVIENSALTNPSALSGVQTGQGLAVDATTGNTDTLAVSNVTFQYWDKNGIDAETGDGTGANGGNIDLTVQGSSFTGAGSTGTIAQNGIVLWEQGGGTINATVNDDSFADLSYSDPANATAAGVLVYGSPNGTTTVENSTFDSSVQTYISTAGGNTHGIDATDNNTFGGITVSAATPLSDIYTVENSIIDGTNSSSDGTDGLVRLVDGNVYLTAANGNLQGAVNDASSGDTVNIQAGTYDGTMDITKNVDIEGAGVGQTIIQPSTTLLSTGVGHKYTSNMQTTVFVNGASDVTLNGLTIDGNDLGNDAVVFWNNASGSITNSLIENAKTFDGTQTGQGLAVDATTGNNSNLTVSNVTFQNWNKNGIDAETGDGTGANGGNINLTVTGSSFTGAGSTGTIAQNGIVLWEQGGGTINATVNDDSFADLSYSDPANATAAGVLQYGSANGTVTVENSTFDNVQEYISTAGSTHEIDATNNNTFDGITVSASTPLSDIYTVENSIADGTSDGTSALVRLVAGNVYLTATNGSLQGAINDASAGDTVNIQAGTYDGTMDITKNVDIEGAGEGQTIIQPSTTLLDTGVGHKYTSDMQSTVFVNGASDVTLNGLTIDGNDLGNDAVVFWNNASGSITNSLIENAKTFDGTQTGQDLAVDATSGNTSTLAVTGVTFQNWNKNGIDAETGDGTGANGGNIDLTVTGSSFTGAGSTNTIAQNGIVLWEQGGGTIDATINGDTFSDLSYADPTSDTAAGVLVYGSPTGTTTVENSTFDSSVQEYISTAGGNTHGVDATNNNTFGGITVSASTPLSDLYTVEDSILDGTSDGTDGLVRLVAGNVYLTATNGSLEGAVNGASSGDTINIQAGTYEDQANINKDLTVIGAGVGQTIIDAPDNMAVSATVSGTSHYAVIAVTNNATASISGLTVDGLGKGSGTVYKFDGIGIYNASATIDGVDVTGIREGGVGGSFNGDQHGVGVDGYNTDGVSRTITLENSSIEDFQKNATAFDGGNLTVNVLDNTITGDGATSLNAQNGIQFYGIAGDGNGVVTGTISGNTISGIGYTQNNNSSTDILLLDASGTTVSNNTLTGTSATDSSNGIYVSGSTGVTVSANTVQDFGWGVDVGNSYGTPTVSVTNNVITGNGVGVDVGDNATDNSVVTVNGNSITGNTNAVELDTADATTDFTGNWWGTTNDTDIANSMTGTAVSDINFSNFLASGVDTAPTTPGFQGDFSTLDVTALGAGADRIGAAIDSVTTGGTVNVLAGTYTLPGEIDITKALTLQGAGVGSTILNSNSGGYNLFVDANDVTLAGFTLNGSSSGTYGIKVQANPADPAGANARLTNFDINNVDVDGSKKTGLDLNGVDGATIDHVSVSNTVSGNGIALTDSADVTLTNDTTTNNAWGGLALYQTNTFTNQQVNNITVDGTNTFNEANGIYAQDQSATNDFGTINLTGQGINYIAQLATGGADGVYTFFQNTEQGAIDLATAFNTRYGSTAATVQGYAGTDLVGNNSFYVGYNTGDTSALSIGAAVAAASSGADINVGAGTYTLPGELDINNGITLSGAGVGSTTITSNSTGYGIYVDADNTTLEGFTFNAPTAVSGSTYGIKVEPGTANPSDRLTGFDINNVTINGGYRTGLDLNGANGATIDHVAVSNVVHGNGIALTDSANVTLTNDTTTNNAWGGLALYQTNTYYNQQLNNISVDATNTFNEANGIYEEDQSSLWDVGSNVAIAGYNYADIDKSVANDQYTFFQKTEQGAIDFATDATANSGHLSLANTYVEGWNGTALNGDLYVGQNSGSGQALSIQAAVNGASAGNTINVNSGTYAEDVSAAKQLAFDFGDVDVNSFTLTSAAGGSSLSGDLTATGAIADNAATSLGGTFTAGSIALNGATTLTADTTLDAGSVTTGSVDGAHALTVDATTASLGNLGATTTLGAVSDNAATTLTGGTYNAASLNFGGATTLTADTTLDAGSVTTGSVDGAHALTVEATTASLGNLGATTALGAVADNAATTLTGSTYDAASLNFSGATTLTADTTLDAGSVTTSSVDGAHALTVDATTASLGNLGATTALGAVSDNAATTLTGGTYNAASINLAGATTLTADTTLNAASVTTGSVDGTHALTVKATTASLGNLGATTALGAVSDNAATTLTGGTYDASSLSFGALTLTADTALDATGSVTAGSIDGDHALTVDAANASLGDLGATTALGAVTDNAATTLTGGTYDAASIALNGATTLTADTTLAANSVTTGSVDGAHALTVDATTASLGNLGAATALGAVTDNATTTLTGGTYNADSIALNGATTLTADTTLNAGSVTTASIDGAHALAIEAKNASLGNLGAKTALGAVTDNAATTLNGGIYDAASLNFAGATTLTADTVLDATGSVTTASVDGAHALTVKAATASLGNLGASTRLGAVSDSAATTLTGGTYDAASLNFGGATTLTTNTTLNATGSVTTASVDGAHALTVDATTASLGNLGAKTALGAVTDHAVTTLTGSTYDAASLNFGGATTLTTNTTLNATGSVTTASVDGAHALTVDATTASLGNLGAKTALGAVTDHAVTTLTGSTYDAAGLDFGALTLAADATLDATGSVTAGSIDGAHALTVDAATASLGNLGATTALGAVTDNAATTLTGGTYNAASIALNGATTLTADTTLAANSVTTGSVDGADALTVDATTASLGNLGATTALGAVTDNAATTLTGGTYNAASIALNGATTLTADTTLDATGSLTAGSIDGAHALTVDATTASLGNLGATTRLGAVTDNAVTTLAGSTYNADSFDFGGAVTLVSDTTTLNTTQPSTAGDIVFNGDILGTTDGGQNLVLIAGPGKGAAAADGNISLQNAGTTGTRLDNLTVSGNNFTALTVDLAGSFSSSLAGNQVFAADTLNAGGSVNSNVGGNSSGHIVAQGNVNLTVGGSLSGTISGQNVDVQSASISDADITGSQSIGIQTGDVTDTSLTAPVVIATTTSIDATVNASTSADISGNTISGSFSGGDIALQASNNVDATVNSTDLSVTAPSGTVAGTWTNLSTDGSGTLNVNGEAVEGSGNTNPNQLVVEGFVLPAGSTITASGQLILPEGVVLGLLSPGGDKKPKVILVHDVRELGELLAAGYTAIVIDVTGQTKSLPTQLAMN